MSKPVSISIPHRLGKAEARRRLEGGLGSVRSHFASVLNVEEEVWSGDSLAFRARALGQQTSGTITVADDHVQVDVMLPWALALLTEKATALIRSRGQIMLDKK
jgi:Putative polyhydroxyalkanoic acid system protein (PHA_gran_rgn)